MIVEQKYATSYKNLFQCPADILIFEVHPDMLEQKNATCCKNLSQGGFKMEIHKDFYFEAVLNDYLRKDNMDVFVTGRSS